MDYKLSTTQQSEFNYSSAYSQENRSYPSQSLKKTQPAEPVMNKPKQWQYSKPNLPIIYDKCENSKTIPQFPKHSTNSRVIYGQAPKDDIPKYSTNSRTIYNQTPKDDPQQIVTSSIPYESTISQIKSQPPLINANAQYKHISYSTVSSSIPANIYRLQSTANTQIKDEQAQIKPSPQFVAALNYTSNFKNPTTYSNRFQSRSDNQQHNSNSKFVVDKNVPTFNYHTGRNSSNTKQIHTEISPEKAHTFGKLPVSGNYLQTVNYPIYTVPSIPIITKPVINTFVRQTDPIESHHSSKTSSQIRNNNIIIPQMQTLQTSKTTSQSLGMNYLSMQTVPKVMYDRCVNQCKNWQTKYNQLYLKHMSLAASTIDPNSQELQHLRYQNSQLKSQLRQSEDKKRQVTPHLSYKLNQLVSSLQQSTIKQCMLLMERFRLQCKQKF